LALSNNTLTRIDLLLGPGIVQSVQRLATGRTVRGSSPVGVEIFRTGPGAHPAFYTMGTECFPGVKRPRRGVEHPPQSSTGVKERVGLNSTLPLGLGGLLKGELQLYLTDLLQDLQNADQ